MPCMPVALAPPGALAESRMQTGATLLGALRVP